MFFTFTQACSCMHGRQSSTSRHTTEVRTAYELPACLGSVEGRTAAGTEGPCNPSSQSSGNANTNLCKLMLRYMCTRLEDRAHLGRGGAAGSAAGAWGMRHPECPLGAAPAHRWPGCRTAPEQAHMAASLPPPSASQTARARHLNFFTSWRPSAQSHTADASPSVHRRVA